MCRGWKSFRVHGRKSPHDREQTIKSNSGESSEKKRRVVEKASFFLENT